MNMTWLQKILRPYHRRIMNLVSRGVVKLVNSSIKMQSLQVTLLSGEVLDDIEHWEQYGFTAHPKKGAEALAVSLGGNRNHSIVISVANREYRLQGLDEGEVALYTDEGDSIILKRGNNIEINAGTQVTVNSPSLHCSGDINCDGDINDSAGSMQTMRDTYNAHTHADPQGGNVSPTTDLM